MAKTKNNNLSHWSHTYNENLTPQTPDSATLLGEKQLEYSATGSARNTLCRQGNYPPNNSRGRCLCRRVSGKMCRHLLGSQGATGDKWTPGPSYSVYVLSSFVGRRSLRLGRLFGMHLSFAARCEMVNYRRVFSDSMGLYGYYEVWCLACHIFTSGKWLIKSQIMGTWVNVRGNYN